MTKYSANLPKAKVPLLPIGVRAMRFFKGPSVSSNVENYFSLHFSALSQQQANVSCDLYVENKMARELFFIFVTLIAQQ